MTGEQRQAIVNDPRKLETILRGMNRRQRRTFTAERRRGKTKLEALEVAVRTMGPR